MNREYLLLEDAVNLFTASDDIREKMKEQAIFEDVESPKRRQAIETLYESILDKRHVDFDTIPKSAGDITKYTGYRTMMDTLSALKVLSVEEPNTYKSLLPIVKTIQNAIANIASFSTFYMAAFSQKNELLMIEYNMFVYTCVEATTSILYQYANFLKTPSSKKVSGVMTNTKYRADLFYIEQLQKYNQICLDSSRYTEYLKGILKMDGKMNFLGDPLIIGSIAIVSTVLLAIIPTIRALLYSIQDVRGKLAEGLELQAYFLEMNRSYLEANKTMDPAKKKKIMDKQETVRLRFLRLADKLRVKSVRAEELGRKSLNEDNRVLSLDRTYDSEDISVL